MPHTNETTMHNKNKVNECAVWHSEKKTTDERKDILIKQRNKNCYSTRDVNGSRCIHLKRFTYTEKKKTSRKRHNLSKPTTSTFNQQKKIFFFHFVNVVM